MIDTLRRVAVSNIKTPTQTDKGNVRINLGPNQFNTFRLLIKDCIASLSHYSITFFQVARDLLKEASVLTKSPQKNMNLGRFSPLMALTFLTQARDL